MAGTEIKKLSKVAKEFNVAMNTIVDFLKTKGQKIDANPNAKLSEDLYELLLNEFSDEKKDKEVAASISKAKMKREGGEDVIIETSPLKKIQKDEPEEILIKDMQSPKEALKKNEEVIKAKAEKLEVNVKGKIDLDSLNAKTKPDKKSKKKDEEEKAKTKKTTKKKKGEETVAEETPVEEITTEPVTEKKEEDNFLKTEYTKLEGPKILKKIDLPVEKKPVRSEKKTP